MSRWGYLFRVPNSRVPPWARMGGYLAGGSTQVWYPPGRYLPPGPGQDGEGYPVRTTEGVLTTRRAVCLLHSRRRTFLSNNKLAEFSNSKRKKPQMTVANFWNPWECLNLDLGHYPSQRKARNFSLRWFEFFTIGVSIRFCQIFTQGRAKKLSINAPSGDWNQDLQIFRRMPYQLS